MEEALALLRECGEDAKLFAGGQSLMMLMRHRLIEPDYLIGLGGIPELKGIGVDASAGLRIGGMTTQRSIEKSSLVTDRCNILVQAAKRVASIPVRNLGTLGGNLCHGEPGADPPAALIAAAAKVKLVGSQGERLVNVEDFFVDYLETVVRPDEIATEILVPESPVRSGGVYLKCSRRAVDFALVGVGVVVTLASDNSCQDIRIGLNGVDVKPIRAWAAESVIRGAPITESVLEEAGRVTAENANPLSDAHASADYRRKMIAVYLRRAVKQACVIARGGGEM